MSLFQERANSSKRIISLENELISLKNQIAGFNSRTVEKSDCSDCIAKISELELLVQSQKAELKKIKSDLTRTKNKLTKLQLEDV